MTKDRFLFPDLEEDPDYLSKQVITYIGNKRSLLAFIDRGTAIVKNQLGRDKLDLFDVFSGSGIVSRFFKRSARRLVVNDLEKYSEVINSCYLANASQIDIAGLADVYKRLKVRLETEPLRGGIIAELYAPRDDTAVQAGERVFYTRRNAAYLDTARQYIEHLPAGIRSFFLAPLLSEASIHANTSGVFKGFYKDARSGLGRFGGSNGDALSRIKGDIDLPFPLFSRFECEVDIHRGDSNVIAGCIDEVDVAYLDPPYNQHPYGSNYFMLNLLLDYVRPLHISEVSGIPADWNRSLYNNRDFAYTSLAELTDRIRAKYLLVSFNSEGFIGPDDMIDLLRRVGSVQLLETDYNTFRGSRNLRNRPVRVKEYLYLVRKH